MDVGILVLFTPVFHVRHATHSVCHLKRWKWFRAVPYVGGFCLVYNESSGQILLQIVWFRSLGTIY